jgi:hypothetical protein
MQRSLPYHMAKQAQGTRRTRCRRWTHKAGAVATDGAARRP